MPIARFLDMEISPIHRVVEPAKAEETPKIGRPPAQDRPDAKPPAAVRDRRIGAAMAAVSQVGDLLVDVRKGIEENQSHPERLEANRHLLEAAAASVNFIVQAASTGGSPVFSEPRSAGRPMGGIRGYQAHQQAMAWSTMAVEQDPAARGALARVQGRLAGPEGVAAGLKDLARRSPKEAAEALGRMESLIQDSREDLLASPEPSASRF